MSSEEQVSRRGELYGAFAYASVILTCYLQFVTARRIEGEAWQVAVAFGAGAVYAALGVLGEGGLRRWGEGGRVPLYWVMVAVVAVALYTSPVRGFFGILVLPLVSQAVFDYGWRGAAAAALGLFALSVGVFGVYYGMAAMGSAALSFTAAFAFTVTFSAISKQALTARERSEALRRELETANEKLRAFAAQAEELATTRERNRVAREIHDGVGHYLTVAKTQLDVAAALLPGQPERAREAVVKAARQTVEALDDVRRSVGALRSERGPAALPERLRQLGAETEVAVVVEGLARRLEPGVAHALWRAAQEGVTNAQRHAAGATVEVRLDYRVAERVRLVVRNGRAPRVQAETAAAAAPGGGGGFGLVGLRERFELLGGRVTAGPRAEGGFALEVEVPA